MRHQNIDSKFRTHMLLMLVALLAWTGPALAQKAPSHLPSRSDLVEMQLHNEKELSNLDFGSLSAQRTHSVVPYAEYNEPGYLIISAEEDFDSSHVKKALIENLPLNMTAIIYTDSTYQSEIDRLYKKYISYAKSPSQIRIAYIKGSYRGFWARDAVPVPVWKKELSLPIEEYDLGVVDARYYHRFEPDAFFAEAFQASVTSYNFYYEGGNFVPNSKGDCLIVDKVATQDIPDAIFLNHYGCTNLVRLEHLVGIGHADEVVKFVADDHILTDQHEYKKVLEARGFKVTMLPEGAGEYETYVNSLIINQNVFVPVFGRGSDKTATEIYENLGFNVIPLNTSTLSNQGAGSIHCITMTYPQGVTYDKVIDSIAGKDITPNMINVITSAKGMPLDHFPELETYETRQDDDYVTGFMEPEENTSHDNYDDLDL